MSLETAPPEVKLAVDLIELLETNELAPELVLAALAIVKNDYERKRRGRITDPSPHFFCLILPTSVFPHRSFSPHSHSLRPHHLVTEGDQGRTQAGERFAPAYPGMEGQLHRRHPGPLGQGQLIGGHQPFG